MKADQTPEERALLKAIRAKPEARAIRLIYADWLDERSDPRGELIRIEEEVRIAAIYSDMYWQLKPRRRELLKSVEKPWLKQMGYGGTDYQPVFADVPVGWKERWRLLREFVERWYQIPMDDVGGPLKPFPPRNDQSLEEGDRRTVNEAMNDPKVNANLSPSLREWILSIRDLQLGLTDFDQGSGNRHIFRDEGERIGIMSPGNGRESFFVRDEHRHEPDPPVWRDSIRPRKDIDESHQVAPRATTLALHYFLTRDELEDGEGENEQKMTKKFARQLAKCFPVRSHFDELQLFERPNVIALWVPESPFNGEAPCFRLMARTRANWEEVFDQLFEVDQ